MKRTFDFYMSSYQLIQSAIYRWGLFFLAFINFGPNSAIAGSPVDSLYAILQTHIPDTTRVNILNAIASQLQNTNPDSSIHIAHKAQEISIKIKWGFGIASSNHLLGNSYYLIGDYTQSLDFFDKALTHWEQLEKSVIDTNLKKRILKNKSATLSNMGIVYDEQGNFQYALAYYSKSLEIARIIGNKKSSSFCYGNIGVVYLSMADYPRAIEYFLNALKIDEEIQNKSGVARHINNLGGVYQSLGELDKALGYFINAYQLEEKLGNERGAANLLGNIGIIYLQKKEYSLALEYFTRSLKISEALGDKGRITAQLGNIAILYSEQKENAKALEIYLRVVKIAREMGDNNRIAIQLNNIGRLLLEQRKYKEAETYLFQSLEFSDSSGALAQQSSTHESLGKLYKNVGNYRKALYHFEKHVIFRDSIFKLDNQKEIIRKQMKFDYEKKATADSVKNAEEQKVKEAQIQAQQAQIKQEQTQRYALYGGLALVLLFAGFIYNRFRVTQKQKVIIEEQKKMVETKNEEILDSIHYAQRIQQALLPTDFLLKKYLPEHFIFYRPKDIVSGDFYYLTPCPSPSGEGSETLLALCDCTGHGVPGAFMSLLNISFLNEIISEKKITSPDEILNHVRDKVVKVLNPEGGSEKGMDGMDCSLVNVETSKLGVSTLKIACANNPVYIVSKGIMTEIKPNRQPVGFSYNPKPFTLQEIELLEGDVIYLITDGFGDQFGGPKGKRFKKINLKELLLSVSDKPMEDQKNILEQRFTEWKGNSEQTDDVTVIGIKIS